MADTLSIEAKTKLAAAIAQLNQLAVSLGLVGKQAGSSAGGMNQAGAAAGNMATKQSQASKSTSELSSALGGLQTALAAVGIGQFVKDSTDLYVQQEQAINILAGATGTLPAAREELERWRHVTETLGLEFNKSSVLYARLLVTAEQANIPIENARAAADGLAIAQRAMNLSSYDAELAFRALGQIANKNVVNMEELRQQLGERVAGVMKALSDKMGITTRDLFKLAETGELSAQVFFERFGPAMAEAFKDQAITNADSLAANLERIGNAANRIKVEFAKGFGEELNQFIKESPAATKGAEQGFRGLGQAVGVLLGWLSDLAGQFNKIRSIMAQLQGWLLDGAAAFVEFTEDSLQALGDLYAYIARGAKAVGLDTVSKQAQKFAEAAFEGGKKAGLFAEALRPLAESSFDVAKEQAKAQREMDKAGKTAEEAAKDINALADGADTTAGAFNKLDPEVAKFIDRINELGKKTDVTVAALNKMMAEGPLSPAQLAAARDEVEKLVKAYDFKDIPPELLSLAKALGVATESTKKNTDATKAQAAANRELLQEINKVTDALERQAQASKEAAEENRKKIAELEEKNLTGIDPDELNLLDELKGKQFEFDQQAKRDAEAVTEARELLADANRAAGQTAEESALQYDKAAISLLGVEEASQNARDRLLELQAAFASSGGAAGRFAVPGGSPGAPSGPGIGPFTPGVVPPGGMGFGGAPPPGYGYGPGGNEYQAPGQLWGGSDENGNPIDLFNALDTGIPGTDPNVIAQMLVDQWTSAADKALLEAVKEQPSKNPVRIEEGKQGAIGTMPNAFGVEPGPGGNAEQAIKTITNVKEAADQAGEVLVDAFEDGSASMFNLGIAAKDAGAAVKGVGDEASKSFVGPIRQAADAVGQIPTAANDASAALAEAAGAGVDYSDAIIRAEGATGDLGFTAEATAGSIAEAAGANIDLVDQARKAAESAIEGQAGVKDAAQLTTEELIKQVELYLKIDKIINGTRGQGDFTDI